jgi:3-deoxy-7-phosphoheptulonate synthase
VDIRTEDLRIREMRELITPEELTREYPCSVTARQTVATARSAVHRILHGHDDRLIVVIGPCSIHDVPAALEYAGRLRHERDRWQGTLEIVMRVYFEKPRTTVGWKGLINDPDLDGSFRINHGLRLARGLLLAVAELGVPRAANFSTW